ncbi:M48 family metallopeptidase, partial [bacterium]|nr:M48 family metallopeptidase [bacterium]
MLTTIIGIYSLYVLIKIYVSVMQIGFVNTAKRQGAVLMSSAEYLKAGNYAVAKEQLAMFTTLVDFLLFIAWIRFGIGFIEHTFMIYDPAMAAVLSVLAFILVNGLISLPFAYYEKFVLDAKFGFNRSSKALFIKDTLISTMLTVVFGALVIWGIYLIIASTELWWLWSFGFIFVMIVLLNMFFPTLRALFFDKLTPLEDEELAKQISALMDKTGFKSSGVFISDASKRDARLNAYFGGLGKTKRVVLFDTLLQKLTPNELLAVLGHELGHFQHGDIYKNIALIGGMLFAMFALFGNLPDTLYMEIGIQKNAASMMILFMLAMPLLGFVMMPVMGIVSRYNEYAADQTGADLGGKLFLSEALKKLVSENKSFPLSHPIYIFFYY